MNQIIKGDVLEVLKTMSSESVDCCITSPPYWGLRDYGTAKWEGGDSDCEHTSLRRPGEDDKSFTNDGTSRDKPTNFCRRCGAKRIDKQIGLEPTPEEYVAKMVAVFAEVKRVLKKEGTLWLNLGDSYMSSGGASRHWGYTDPKWKEARKVEHFEPQAYPHETIKPKDIVGIPWRVAFALQADGWYLRQDIIWAKPNPMPESVTDRCTKSHEYVFLMAKSSKYFYDAEAIKEPSSDLEGSMNCYKSEFNVGAKEIHGAGRPNSASNTAGMKTFNGFRNRRSVWTITTKPFREAHFATFPEDLIEPMVKAGTSEKGVCPDCGKAWVRVVETKNNERTLGKGNYGLRPDEIKMMPNKGSSSAGFVDVKTLGWQPQCQCNQQPVPAIVLDPFIGSGTTAVVAKRLGRNYIGIELNPKYCEMAEISIKSMREPETMKILKDVYEGRQKSLIGLKEFGT